MKTISSIADTTPTAQVRPDWAQLTETSRLPDGTPTLLHSTTTDGDAWMVTVEREDPINEDGTITHGTPKVLVEYSGDGSDPAEIFAYAEALRSAAHLLVDQRAAH